MANKSYKKLSPNPLWLGKGLTITDEEFSDKGFNEVNKAKLKAAKRVGLVKEIDAVVEAKQKAGKTDGRIDDLEEELELVKAERDEALQKLADLDKGDASAWLEMSEEELAKKYTVPELKALITDNFEDVKIDRRIKEAALAKMLVGLIAKANSEFDENKDEGSTTENPTSESGEGSEA